MKIAKTLVQSIVFSLFLSILFICIRLIFILYVGIGQNALETDVSFYQIFQTLLDGAKYDNRTVAIIGIIFFLLGFIFIFSRLQKPFLSFYAGFVFVICIFLGIANMVFYNIYGDIFDGNLLGIIFDDQKAIFQTGIEGNYHIGIKVVFLLLASFVTIYLYSKILSFAQKIVLKNPRYPKIFNLVLFLIFAFIMLIFINSHLGFKALSLDQHIRPSENAFLRKVTPGAFRDLYLVYTGYQTSMHSKFSDFSQESLIETTKNFFSLPQDAKPPFNLTLLLSHTSQNNSPIKIKHIFYIISESLSEWHFDSEFDTIGLTSGLKSLIDGKHGFKVKHFLENAPSTIKSLDVQITGLFQTDIPLNTMVGNLPLFPTAIAGILRHLGYDTRFYYGGSGIWQKLDRYTTSQGFNKILYNANILDYAKNKNYPKPLENLWGVYDNILFDYIIQNTSDSKQPTFNMIMTTSNHPPYNVDLKSFGVPLEGIKKFLQTHFHNKKRFQDANENVLGHIWWYDKQITHFVKKASKLFPDSLFIITGDHFDRMYPLARRNNRVVKSIPLIIYAPSLTPKQLSEIGSHIDIAPTIIELVSPKGFQYDSFGKPLFSNNHNFKTNDASYALGYFAIATNRFIYTPDFGIQYFDTITPIASDTQQAQKLYNKLQEGRALSWWMFSKGNEIQ